MIEETKTIKNMSIIQNAIISQKYIDKMAALVHVSLTKSYILLLVNFQFIHVLKKWRAKIKRSSFRMARNRTKVC